MSFSSLLPKDFGNNKVRKVSSQQPSSEELFEQLKVGRPAQVTSMINLLIDAYRSESKKTPLSWEYRAEPAMVSWVTESRTRVKVELLDYDTKLSHLGSAKTATSPTAVQHTVAEILGKLIDARQIKYVADVLGLRGAVYSPRWFDFRVLEKSKNTAAASWLICYDRRQFGYRVTIDYNPVVFLTYGGTDDDADQ